MVRIIFQILLVVAACGNVQGNGPYDASIDSSIDAPPDAPPLREAREFVSGGTRMTSATYMLDVQVGHSLRQSNITGSTYKFEGNAAVKP